MNHPGDDLRPATVADALSMAVVMERASTHRKSRLVPNRSIDSDIDYLVERLGRPGAWCRVAIMNGEIVGFVAGNPLMRDGQHDSDTQDLGLIMVAPDWQGYGIGRKLLEWAAGYHGARKVKFLELWTQEDNTRARRLYESLGSTLTGETKMRQDESMVRYRLSL